MMSDKTQEGWKGGRDEENKDDRGTSERERERETEKREGGRKSENKRLVGE